MKKTPPVIPWRQWMELGLGVMHFSPDDFWRMSLAEWLAARDGFMAANGQGLGVQPIMEEELSQLMKTYPDRKTDIW